MIISQVIFNVSRSQKNQFNFYIFDENDCHLIYPLNKFDTAYVKMMNFNKVRETINERILEFLEKKELTAIKNSKIIKALSKALCRMNKFKAENKLVQVSGRIMVIFNSELKNENFSQLMSCVFVCQHRGYIIDSINLNRIS